MAFSTFCNTKGCGQVEPYIDPKSDKVYCSKCDQEILNITYFAKSQMKSMKQFKPKPTNAYSVKCNNCNRHDKPNLLKNKLYCSRVQKRTYKSFRSF